MSIPASAMPTSPCVPSSLKRAANVSAMAVGASGWPLTSGSMLTIRSATGRSAAAVYVKSMAWPVMPSSVIASTSTRGDSVITPLAVRCGSRMGTRTARARMVRITGIG